MDTLQWMKERKDIAMRGLAMVLISKDHAESIKAVEDAFRALADSDVFAQDKPDKTEVAA